MGKTPLVVEGVVKQISIFHPDLACIGSLLLKHSQSSYVACNPSYIQRCLMFPIFTYVHVLVWVIYGHWEGHASTDKSYLFDHQLV